jgi:hypothetical protein
MKTYTISKKKIERKNKKEEKKTSNMFLSLKMRFFGSENGGNVLNFSWPRECLN